jgi:eukaryotic-like serine/threonine-protein kinase
LNVRTGSHTPSTIGAYTILERFAPGSFAELFKARKTSGGPTVCLKRIPPSISDDVDFVLRFEDEITLAEQLHHPNIVEVFDHGEDEGHFYVMELVDGLDFSTLLDRVEVLEPALVAYVGAEVARALDYIHRSDPASGRMPLIHFDVSPQNILVGRNGAVKLSDFGLARALRSTGAETITATRGKQRYLSPEQWLDESVGSKSDLFALGLVLWGALIGTHPYAEGRPRDVGLDEWIRERTIRNERRPLIDAAPAAPGPLQLAIEGLLRPSATRTANAATLFEAVSPIVSIDAPAMLAGVLRASG